MLCLCVVITAGGFLTLQICGQYDAPEVIGTADYFLAYDIPSLQAEEHFYYGMYYTLQGNKFPRVRKGTYPRTNGKFQS